MNIIGIVLTNIPAHLFLFYTIWYILILAFFGLRNETEYPTWVGSLTIFIPTGSFLVNVYYILNNYESPIISKLVNFYIKATILLSAQLAISILLTLSLGNVFTFTELMRKKERRWNINLDYCSALAINIVTIVGLTLLIF